MAIKLLTTTCLDKKHRFAYLAVLSLFEAEMFAQVTFGFASCTFLGFCVTFWPALFSNAQEFPSFPLMEITQRSRGWI